ncbi:hypothetical protein NP493_199g06076 [Ridgeia piscesae]|uniref:NEDD8-activating enzyme E1 regulatory subunit n=1 Tax=Ridgeia piscesae TaxID=27915 RepID=A0AAD9P1N7_RIDPI|nr:hypothetical protein NP493_199g06076 [Ridgeia piscesae]
MESGPAEKSKKYDRQLRLWGDHGQAALESAKVCLVNATATGTEILKNIILPGIGSFTIVDAHKVSGEDIGNNFFLEKDTIGKSRAQVATELLLELNEDVNGDFIEETVDNLLRNNSGFFQNFHMVIVTDLPERTLVTLAAQLWESDTPLLVCRSYGLIGYMRMVLKEHTVVESHPDNAIEDLRLDHPFRTLTEYCNAQNMAEMTKKEHSHTPWLVIIYKFLEDWKKHNGEMPRNYKEKSKLKEMIREGILKNQDLVPEDEENFDEAIRNVNSTLVPTKSKPFWILARAVKEFVQNEGQGRLPVRGSIPDMTADSERYIQLQNIYKEQALQDIAIVTNYVHQLLQTLGRPQDNISDSDIKTFCKNASFLQLIRCRSLAQEYDPATANHADIAMHLEDTDDDDLVFYILLRAVDRFYSQYSKYPGCYGDSMEADIPKLKACVSKLLQDWGITQNVKDDYVHEFCRYGASELHSVAAYMGGVAAQEVIKVITHQFIPINNTYIYNAMKQSSITVQM